MSWLRYFALAVAWVQAGASYGILPGWGLGLGKHRSWPLVASSNSIAAGPAGSWGQGEGPVWCLPEGQGWALVRLGFGSSSGSSGRWER